MHRLCCLEPHLASTNDDWIYVTYSSDLLNLNKNWFQATELLDSEFNNMHGTLLPINKIIFKTLADRIIFKFNVDMQ